MPSFYDQLKEAQIENVTSDKITTQRGLIWFRTDTKALKIYDGAVIRTISLGSNGGGGSLLWVPDDAGNAATDLIENSQKVWTFETGLAQLIYTVVKVPTGYSAGDPITMKILGYGPDGAGTILFTSVATLIRTGITAFSSTTNQRTSTNTAATPAGANIPFSASLDLTSTTGTINSVAVAAGDLIKVSISRGTDTMGSDARLIESSTEVLFS